MNFIGQGGLEKKDLDNNKTLIFNSVYCNFLKYTSTTLETLHSVFHDSENIHGLWIFTNTYTHMYSKFFMSRQSNKYVFNIESTNILKMLF